MTYKDLVNSFINKLVRKYHYSPLFYLESQKARQWYKEKLPKFLSLSGADTPLYTLSGTRVCDKYDRIVIGDYGAYIEFSKPAEGTEFTVKKGQEFRVTGHSNSNSLSSNDMKYIKYIWLTIEDGSNIKIYNQIDTVRYADYKVGKYYISPYAVCSANL